MCAVCVHAIRAQMGKTKRRTMFNLLFLDNFSISLVAIVLWVSRQGQFAGDR